MTTAHRRPSAQTRSGPRAVVTRSSQVVAAAVALVWVGSCAENRAEAPEPPISEADANSKPPTDAGRAPEVEAGSEIEAGSEMEAGSEPPRTPGAECGNGRIDGLEPCDDGNTTSGDGCLADCSWIEQGYTCAAPGMPCERVAVCGDGVLTGSERCDDGNRFGSDGCTARCQMEAEFECPLPGTPCLAAGACGDGLISGLETCDDSNAIAGDGCSNTCELEPGWTCHFEGKQCAPICGDGLIRPLEQCDDGNGESGDGCSNTCGEEPGFFCSELGGMCTPTICGNGLRDGLETCDEGSVQVPYPFDGCYQCISEPLCPGGRCEPYCGDGVRENDELCDDGNENNGDGCNHGCEVEAGFECTDVGLTGPGGEEYVVPVIYRDFIGADTSGDGQEGSRASARTAASVQQHPDFNRFDGMGILGVVQNQLGVDGVPVFACGDLATCPGVANGFTGSAEFNQWFKDVAGVNVPVVKNLTLQKQVDGSLVFDSSLPTSESPAGQFNPLLGDGWQTAQAIGGSAPAIYEGPEFCDGDQLPTLDGPSGSGTARNLSFTAETHFVFQYTGGETLEVESSDDVWVFVNNQLVIDLGGVHDKAVGNFTLGGSPNPGRAIVRRTGPNGSPLTSTTTASVETQTEFGVFYEVALFYAQRRECRSHFKLTLTGFQRPSSRCRQVCGDGVVSHAEGCDDGLLNGEGYGRCQADCTPGPRCGDGILNGDETCDNGSNVDLYSVAPGACAPGCKLPSRCGDGVVDGAHGEECDDRVNDNSYNGCAPTCTLGPYCGDQRVNGEEECDDGNQFNGDGCSVICKRESLGVE